MRARSAALLVLCLATAAQGAVFSVTTTSDSGPGSLRQAIADANASPGLDTIDFNINAIPVRPQIETLTPLVITSPLFMDGSSQTTQVPVPVIIDRFAGAGDGVVFAAGSDGSTMRNIEVRSVAGSVDVAAVRISGGTTVLLSRNYIGPISGGGRNSVGIRISTFGNTIGGVTGADRNVISGNDIGIKIDSGASANSITGNYFGVDPEGTARQANSSAAISIEDGHGNQIGGSAAGARNVIAASPNGVIIFKPSTDNRIEGNYIGLDANGEASPGVANVQGIVLGGVSGNSAINNVISNNRFGIVVTEGTNQAIRRNRIGTDPEGDFALPNQSGIVAITFGLLEGLSIGGGVPGDGNQISGNVEDGVYVEGGGNVEVIGNRIGLTANGEVALGNGTGVRLVAASNTVVGGPYAAARNFISGNRGDAIVASRGTIINNAIGLAANATSPLPNGGNGITGVPDGAIEIGQQGFGNLIANNGGWGIDINGNPTSAARMIQENFILQNAKGGIRLMGDARNTIRRNAIFRNGGLGIDLAGDGITPNDSLDSDQGPNLRQNYPVLTRAAASASQLTVTGSLHSAPNKTYLIDFYSNTAPTTTGYGEGEAYVGTLSVTTDGGGNVAFSATLPTVGTALRYITATATDPAGNTSEFSKAASTAPGTPRRHSVRH